MYKLLQVGFVREEKYMTYLANVVLLKKSNGNWWMCVHYINLNKSYSKDYFPLRRIDQLIDFTLDHALLSFRDAFSGCNQIRIESKHKVYTSFVTSFKMYCYKVMPFDLKNAGVTYQGLVIEVFKY